MTTSRRTTRMLLALLLVGLAACSSPSSTSGSSLLGGGKSDGIVTTKASYFDPQNVYCLQIGGWDLTKLSEASLKDPLSLEGARLTIHLCAPDEARHCPTGLDDGLLVAAANDFELRTSGNYTAGTPKPSYKIGLTKKKARVFGMKSLNLKSMWNDVSQMREALVFKMFAHAGVRAPRHTFARFCVNERYLGLYSQIEQVDKEFLGERFGDNDKGNLYKAYWRDIGPADLTYRRGEDGDDSGRQYFVAAALDQRSYELKTNENEDDDPRFQSYDDLAQLIRVINGVGLEGEGDGRFESEAFRRSVEAIFDVKSFLRWASLNLLLGAWDNYWGTPANYYLYNSGKRGAADGFMSQPYFHFVPWDYDHSFGIDYFDGRWQYADIVDWETTTRTVHGGESQSKLPLVTNLLKNRAFLAYYLDHLEWLLDTVFNERWILEQIGSEGSGGIWDLVRQAAFLEADGPTNAPHTGRQFTNDQLYWNGFRHYELQKDGRRILGILHYVRMRHDSARAQLEQWRRTIPRGSSGAQFPERPADLPQSN